MDFVLPLFILGIALGFVLTSIGLMFLRQIDYSFPESICLCGYDLGAIPRGVPCPECGETKSHAVRTRLRTSVHRVVSITATALVLLIPIAIWRPSGWAIAGSLISCGLLLLVLSPFFWMVWCAHRYVSTAVYLMVLTAPVFFLAALYVHGAYLHITTLHGPNAPFSSLIFLFFAAPGTGVAFVAASALAWWCLRYRSE